MRINGAPGTRWDASDRGLHYGDGLFETMAVAAGQTLNWPLHWQRLSLGCQRLGLPIPDPKTLQREIDLEIDGRDSGVLKLLYSRGSGGRGYRPPDDPQPNLLLSWHPAPAYPNEWRIQGIKLRVCATRLACNPSLAGIKHLNRLEQVLARREWQDDEIAEGLMLDREGRAIEATSANLFVFDEGRLFTPSVELCGVAGTMRSRVKDQAVALGIPVEEKAFEPAQLKRSQALFLTNAVIGCWPVRWLEKHEFAFERHIPAELLNWMKQQGLGAVQA